MELAGEGVLSTGPRPSSFSHRRAAHVWGAQDLLYFLNIFFGFYGRCCIWDLPTERQAGSSLSWTLSWTKGIVQGGYLYTSDNVQARRALVGGDFVYMVELRFFGNEQGVELMSLQLWEMAG